MLINIDPLLKNCPSCESSLNLKTPGETGHSSCTNCSYIEVAGSPYFTTFLGDVLQQYLIEQGCTSVYLGKEEIMVPYLFNPRGMLHYVLIRTGNILTESFKGLGLDSLNLHVVPDKKAIFNQRVVLSNNKSDNLELITSHIVTTSLAASKALDETIMLTKQAKPALSSSLCLEFMPQTGEKLKQAFPELFYEAKSSIQNGPIV